MIARNPMCPRCAERPKAQGMPYRRPCRRTYDRERRERLRAAAPEAAPRRVPVPDARTWAVMVAGFGTGWRTIASGTKAACAEVFRAAREAHTFVRLYADGELVATHRAGAKQRTKRKARRKSAKGG